MENKTQLRSPGVLVRVQLQFVLVDFSDKYEMNSMVNRYLINWTIASFGWTNICDEMQVHQIKGGLSQIRWCHIFSCENLLKLQSLPNFIQYCPCGIVIPKSPNGIRVLRCIWTPKFDYNYFLQVYFMRTGYYSHERFQDIHWINNVE